MEVAEKTEKEVKTITNKEVLKRFESLKKVKDLPGVKFAHAVVKNKNKLMTHIDPIRAMEDVMNAPDKQYNEYTKQGSLIRGNKRITTDQRDKKLEALNKKFADTVEKTTKLNKDYFALIAEEIDEVIEFRKIRMADVPEDITGQQLDDLEFMIEDL